VAKPESSHRNTKKKYSHCLYFRLLKKVTGRWPFSRKWEENEMPVAIFVIHNPFVFIQRYSGNFKAENFCEYLWSKRQWSFGGSPW